MLDPEGGRPAVCLAKIAPITAGWSIDVFDEIARLIETARAKVDGQHHLGADRLAPLREFVHADRVRFRGVPGEVKTCWALLARAYPILPVVGRNEIAARIAHDRNPEVPNQIKDVAAHPVCVGARMIGLVN